MEFCFRFEEKFLDFLVVKLYYKMLSYKFFEEDSEDEYESNFNDNKKGVFFLKFNDDNDDY